MKLTILTFPVINQGFPGSSAGKESTCNAGDPGSIPGSGRSTGKGMDYPLQYSWASLVTQTIKSMPAVQETRSPWGREQLPTPIFLPGEFYKQRSLTGYSPWSHKESDTTKQLSLY